MSNANDPAFPINNSLCHDGLTKREYIATKMMASISALDGTWAVLSAFSEKQKAQRMADAAINLTDALLDQLAKERG